MPKEQSMRDWIKNYKVPDDFFPLKCDMCDKTFSRERLHELGRCVSTHYHSRGGATTT